MKFGDILRKLLEENGITQKKLAADLHMGATTIGNYVRGMREPDFETLKLFASYFHVTTDYLLNMPSTSTSNHGEEELLRLYRMLDPEQKNLFLEQGKLLVRMNKTKETSYRSTLQKENNAG